MSEKRLPVSRWLTSTIFALSTTLLAAGLGHAQAPRDNELLDQVQRMEKVKAQKFEAELRQTLQEVQRLPTASSAKAVTRLKKALTELEDDTVLPEARRNALVRMLKDRIRVTEAEAANPSDKAKKPLPAKNRVAEMDRKLAEQKKLQEGLKAIGKLQKEGKTEAAAQEADQLAQESPKQREAFAAYRVATNLDQADKDAKLKKEREQKLLIATREVIKSATPLKGDLEFPPDWRERTKGRTAGVQLTAKEKAIIKALNTPISVSFRDSRLEVVLEYLQTVLDQPILVDMDALKDVEASYDTPITLNVKGVSARTVLRKILAEIGMSYVIKDELIRATSAERAKKMMVVRSYYIGDLVGQASPLGQFSFNGLTIRPLNTDQAQQMQTVQTVNAIMEMVKNGVDSQSWQGNGGDGTVSFHAPSMSLVVKQSAEVHAQLANAGFGK